MSDMLGGSFGSPVDSRLISTIKARERLFGKEKKTDKELEWIHGNTPWVSMRSGVNTPQGGPGTAKTFAMKGGTTGWPGVKGRMFSSGGDSWGAYKVVAFDQGIRPHPGLVSLSARSMDTLGMSVESEVKFKVWSLEDLEAMDQVYFKPGFPVLIEWGHTMYVDESGRCTGVWEEKPWLDDVTFYTEQTFADIEFIIQEKRAKYLNYEAVLGFITNFSYSVQSDGSYECTLKALSKGTVLEGLRVRSGSDFSKAKAGSQDEKAEYLKSVYHLIQEAFQKARWSKSIGALPAKPAGDEELKRTEHPEESVPENKVRADIAFWFDGKAAWKSYDKAQDPPESLQSFLVVALKSSIPRKFLAWTVGKKTDMQFYMKLRDLLTIFNGVNSGNGCILWDLNSKQLYVTSPEHVSLNPGVVVLPKQPTGKLDSCKIPEVFLNPAVKDSYGSTNSDPNQILNLWINFGGFVDIVDNLIDTCTESYALQSAVETLLGEVQKALGNVNNFGIHYNEKEGIFSIIDRNQVGEETDTEPPSIRITGTENTVSAFDIHSEISSNMVTELSVAAQGPSYHRTDSENECEQRLVYWGDGCTSRFSLPANPSKTKENKTKTKTETGVGEEGKDFESLKEKLGKIYTALGAGKAGDVDGSYREGSAGVYSECQLAGENYIKEVVSGNLKNLGEESEGTVQQNGLIPVNATLTLMGIGQFVVGSVFKIDQKLLPVKYSKNWGYVVTGIDHSVDQKGWVTKVKTIGYLLNRKESSKAVYDVSNTAFEEDVVPNSETDRKSPDTDEIYTVEPSTLLAYFDTVFPESHGRCAKGTRCLAWGYVGGKNALKEKLNTSGAGNADSEEFYKGLPSSYSLQIRKEGLTKSEIVSYLGNSSNFREGDVAQYYHTDFRGGPWKSEKGSERHAQFYVSPGHWETDKVNNYGSSFVYRSSGADRYWTLNIFRTSAPRHSDWSGMGSRIRK